MSIRNLASLFDPSSIAVIGASQRVGSLGAMVWHNLTRGNYGGRLFAVNLKDRELAAFYGSLLESEGRHHGLYLRLAAHFAPEEVVRTRLEELAAIEAAIPAVPGALPRFHA